MIVRATIDGTASENITDTGQQVIDDVAVDWLENILFLCDSNNGVISRLDLITFTRIPVISGLLNPRALAIQPQAEIRYSQLITIMVLHVYYNYVLVQGSN